MFGSQGKNLRPIYGKSLINIDERPGLTAPRANDLIGIPVARLNPNPFRQV